MAASAKSLMRAGLISPKAGAKLAVLRGTRAQKSKMTNFNHTEKDEARTHGEVPPNEINHPTNQRHGRRFMPSKGGSVGKTGQPTRAAIDEHTGKKFPAGSSVNKSGKKSVGVRGGSKQNYKGNSYGAPNSRP